LPNASGTLLAIPERWYGWPMATLTSTKACRACTYWHKTGVDQGECRRHAPQTIVFKVDKDMKFESHFPVTKGEDWCGDYSEK